MGLATALLAFQFTGCGDEPEAEGGIPESRLRSGRSTPISGLPVVASEHFGFPSWIAFAYGWLVVLDRRGDPWVHFIDADESRVVKSFGRRGEGPADFGYVNQVLLAPGDSGHVWVFDDADRKLVRFPLSRDHLDASSLKVIRISPTTDLVHDLAWITPDRALGTGYFPEGTFVEIDAGGGVGPVFGPVPEGPPEVPTRVLHEIRYGEIAVNSRLSLVARASLQSGRLDFFALHDGRRVGGADVPVSFTPDLTPPDPRASRPHWREWRYRHKGNHRAYLDLAASDDLLFALFFGGLGRGNSWFEDVEEKGHEVHVFTWSGELVRVFALEPDGPGALALAVDPEACRIWTLVLEPVPAVRLYPVGRFLSAGVSASPGRE